MFSFSCFVAFLVLQKNWNLVQDINFHRRPLNPPPPRKPPNPPPPNRSPPNPPPPPKRSPPPRWKSWKRWLCCPPRCRFWASRSKSCIWEPPPDRLKPPPLDRL